MRVFPTGRSRPRTTWVDAGERAWTAGIVTGFMEYLVFAVILYFVLQTAGNLVFILRGGGESRSSNPSTVPTHDWEGPSPREEMEGVPDHPTFWGDDIEDATWTDVQE